MTITYPDTLTGTVKFYQRHLFICTGQRDWPAKIDIAGGFIQTLAEAIAARADEMPLTVKFTACDEPSAGPGFDLLVFPDGIHYRNVTTADIPALVEAHLVGNEIADDLHHEPLSGFHVFVCIHQRRDQRCGECGPRVADRFEKELERAGLQDTTFVRRTSHVGGHQHAGNVLIYPGGTWYGRVTPSEVPRIVEQHLLHDQLVPDLWRGEMGLTKPQQTQKAAALPG